ncbi:uncharacterized protein PV09_04370 [Verruconis gallopava]|uniref:PNPLA domain-containing protein n=1 Tax=Verruconis gallopava TaxID=253628 RepID=A0A0D2ACK2_9PEZI|nr:uncharacterized protein PV09_04370 [Verruconis gallopava]KIW04623.1 hypothetical protein PV09_04370 [Verruconis gallopava]
MSPPRRLKILSLDGGGIRGRSSLEILKTIMYRVGASMSPPNMNLQPYEYFDLIVGTSTGGIIAIMLGRLRMTIDECIAEYNKLGEKIFKNRRGPPHEFMFSGSNLEHEIKGVIERKLGPDQTDAPLLDPLGIDCCKVVVCTLFHQNVNSSTPQLLRSYVAPHDGPQPPCTIWQAARATSAAPTYFKPIDIGGDPPTRCVDGGMKFNNPSIHALNEARDYWGKRRRLDPAVCGVGLFLSIGTGMAKVNRLEAETFVQRMSSKMGLPPKTIEAMVGIGSDTESTHASMLREDSLDGSYFRFNVEQGLQDVELFEYKKLENIVVDTKNYLQVRTRELDDCVDRMVSLRLNPFPLAERDDLEEQYGAKGSERDEEHLKKRLAALRDIKVEAFYEHEKEFEGSARMFSQTGDIRSHAPYIWPSVVLADLLDRQAVLMWGHTVQQHHLDSDPAVKLSHQVLGLIEANQKWHQAFEIYRRLFHSTRLMWGRESKEHCWVSNRLGKILQRWGLVRGAFAMYCIAKDGRIRTLGPRAHATEESLERFEQTRVLVREQDERFDRNSIADSTPAQLSSIVTELV